MGDIINWNRAMENCGDDEEFLIELLVDFSEELIDPMRRIQNAFRDIQSNSPENYTTIQRAAHVIKGAAANLACSQLHNSSADLEAFIQGAYKSNMDMLAAKIRKLESDVEAYMGFLKTLG
mmetsp:Transcript_6781/g.9767  ORF Transcript_6781/g.9767 Transcript_6781/m.9767 type:complete len:121 (-) Transcript_6781:363-725(-)|eukprot:CAMPEP_0184861840 /NCGR_PEP_ID=MMETSP0580-20130426/6436_1 /TAXON_ID=1118495 /ORGANISM="Dactyliosolen fragilissimus" /LENGTH=120 /DNA_ID=CAMNT_0027359483 /DNA_START=115 /DNA_END=477 /DNA_ORIENTATION=-